MNYFKHLGNELLDPDFLKRLDSTDVIDEISSTGHTCLADWLKTIPSAYTWITQQFKMDSFSHRMTLLCLLAKDYQAEGNETPEHIKFVNDLYMTLYNDDAMDVSDSLYATGIALAYHNLAVLGHDAKMSLLKDCYIPMSVNDYMINFDGHDPDNFFSADIFPLLAKLIRNSALSIEPYISYDEKKWDCELLRTCGTLDILYLPKDNKRSLVEELYALAASYDESIVDREDESVYRFKLTADIVQYASEMGRLALLKGHLPGDVLAGVADLTEVMAQHFGLSNDIVDTLKRWSQVHAAIILPEALDYLDPAFSAADLFGIDVEWQLPENLDSSFIGHNLKLGILSSYESAFGTIDWVPIYDVLLKKAGIEREEFIEAMSPFRPCQSIYLNSKSNYFERHVNRFLFSKKLFETQDNGIYFLSRDLRFQPLTETQLRRLQQLVLKALCRKNSVNRHMVDYYRGPAGLSKQEALEFLKEQGGLNSLDALKAIGAEFNDLKPYYSDLNPETKRFFLNQDLEL